MSHSTSRIMKRHSAAAADAHVVFNYDDMQERLDAYKTQVSDECRREIEQALQEAEQIRQTAFAEARADGYRDGLREAEAEATNKLERLNQDVRRQAQDDAAQHIDEQLGTVLPALGQLFQDFATTSSRRGAEWEQEVIALSLAIAEKILRHEFSTHPDRLAAIVQQALELVVGKTTVTVHLNPNDLAKLGDRLRSLVPDANRFAELQLIASDSVQPSGCLVTTEHGRIDAQLETMLQRIQEELTE